MDVETRLSSESEKASEAWPVFLSESEAGCAASIGVGSAQPDRAVAPRGENSAATAKNSATVASLRTSIRRTTGVSARMDAGAAFAHRGSTSIDEA